MLTDIYLYGEEVEVEPIPAEISMRRIELLQEHLEGLLKVDYRHRDLERVQAVIKAINFWESL